MNVFRGLAALFTLLAMLTAAGGGSPVALVLLLIGAVGCGLASRAPRTTTRS